VLASGSYNNVPEWDDYWFDSDSGEVVLAAKNKDWNTQFPRVPESIGGRSNTVVENDTEDHN
jgi:hypothetical protein